MRCQLPALLTLFLCVSASRQFDPEIEHGRGCSPEAIDEAYQSCHNAFIALTATSMESKKVECCVSLGTEWCVKWRMLNRDCSWDLLPAPECNDYLAECRQLIKDRDIAKVVERSSGYNSILPNRSPKSEGNFTSHTGPEFYADSDNSTGEREHDLYNSSRLAKEVFVFEDPESNDDVEYSRSSSNSEDNSGYIPGEYTGDVPVSVDKPQILGFIVSDNLEPRSDSDVLKKRVNGPYIPANTSLLEDPDVTSRNDDDDASNNSRTSRTFTKFVFPVNDFGVVSGKNGTFFDPRPPSTNSTNSSDVSTKINGPVLDLRPELVNLSNSSVSNEENITSDVVTRPANESSNNSFSVPKSEPQGSTNERESQNATIDDLTNTANESSNSSSVQHSGPGRTPADSKSQNATIDESSNLANETSNSSTTNSEPRELTSKGVSQNATTADSSNAANESSNSSSMTNVEPQGLEREESRNATVGNSSNIASESSNSSSIKDSEPRGTTNGSESQIDRLDQSNSLDSGNSSGFGNDTSESTASSTNVSEHRSERTYHEHQKSNSPNSFDFSPVYNKTGDDKSERVSGVPESQSYFHNASARNSSQNDTKAKAIYVREWEAVVEVWFGDPIGDMDSDNTSHFELKRMHNITQERSDNVSNVLEYQGADNNVSASRRNHLDAVNTTSGQSPVELKIRSLAGKSNVSENGNDTLNLEGREGKSLISPSSTVYLVQLNNDDIKDMLESASDLITLLNTDCSVGSQRDIVAVIMRIVGKICSSADQACASRRTARQYDGSVAPNNAIPSSLSENRSHTANYSENSTASQGSEVFSSFMSSMESLLSKLNFNVERNNSGRNLEFEVPSNVAMVDRGERHIEHGNGTDYALKNWTTLRSNRRDHEFSDSEIIDVREGRSVSKSSYLVKLDAEDLEDMLSSASNLLRLLNTECRGDSQHDITSSLIRIISKICSTSDACESKRLARQNDGINWSNWLANLLPTTTPQPTVMETTLSTPNSNVATSTTLLPGLGALFPANMSNIQAFFPITNTMGTNLGLPNVTTTNLGLPNATTTNLTSPSELSGIVKMMEKTLAVSGKSNAGLDTAESTTPHNDLDFLLLSRGSKFWCLNYVLVFSCLIMLSL